MAGSLQTFVGALVRAWLVAATLVGPALVLPAVAPETVVVALLLGAGAGLLVLLEYSAAEPGVLEFCRARPYNLLRFLALALMVIFGLKYLAGPADSSGGLIGRLGEAMSSDLGGLNPLAQSGSLLGPLAGLDLAERHREMVGVMFLVATLFLVVFILVQRYTLWPRHRGSFNVWLNLPTIDPTGSADIVSRLRHSALANLAIGLIIALALPSAAEAWQALGFVPASGVHGLLWLTVAWAYLPLALIMRAVALDRVARMIELHRRMAPVVAPSEAGVVAA